MITVIVCCRSRSKTTYLSKSVYCVCRRNLRSPPFHSCLQMQAYSQGQARYGGHPSAALLPRARGHGHGASALSQCSITFAPEK